MRVDFRDRRSRDRELRHKKKTEKTANGSRSCDQNFTSQKSAKSGHIRTDISRYVPIIDEK